MFILIKNPGDSGVSLVEIPVPKDNQVSESVGVNDTKNEEKQVRNESEVNQVYVPEYTVVPKLEIPEIKDISKSKLWKELNMDALAVMACYSYLVSIGQIDPKTGKLLNVGR
jgi:hypothetical protein